MNHSCCTRLSALLLLKLRYRAQIVRVSCARCYSIRSTGPIDRQQPFTVRFAPSPTGTLHLGGLRTALINYLFARSEGGRFLLRIEDTDRARFVPGAAEKLIDVLRWAGLEPDNADQPTVQSERLHVYAKHVQTLVANGNAYRCFCTPRRLDLLRREARRNRQIPRYDGRCKSLTERQIEEKLTSGVEHAIRFKLRPLTDGYWEDRLFGKINVESAPESDPVILKGDGYPTYHLANVVDDHLAGVTHVLRGMEWINSTAKHLLLYSAFGWTPPVFAHLPLIVDENGKKLSKRSETSQYVEDFREQGYFPEALLNTLAIHGGGFAGKSVIGNTLEEMVDSFRFETLTCVPLQVTREQLLQCNRAHLGRRMRSSDENGAERKQLVRDTRELVREFLHSLKAEGNVGGSSLQQRVLTDEYIASVLQWSLPRIHAPADLVSPDFRFLWCVPATARALSDPRLRPAKTNAGSPLPAESRSRVRQPASVLRLLHRRVAMAPAGGQQSQSDDEFSSVDRLVILLRVFAAVQELHLASLLGYLRRCLSGLSVGPPVAEMMWLLGREQTLKRLEHAIHLIEERLPELELAQDDVKVILKHEQSLEAEAA